MSASSMPATKRGLCLLTALLLLWAAGGHAFYRIDRAHDERDFALLAELIAHKAKLAEAAPGTRLLVAGGSNAYYGIDSGVMEAALGLPVVNLALPFGAHHDRINLAILLRLVRPGDLVLYASSRFWTQPDDLVRRSRAFDAYLARTGFPRYVRQFEEVAVPWQPLPRTSALLPAIVDMFLPPPMRPWILDTDVKGDFTGCVPTPALAPVRYRRNVLDADQVAAIRETSAAFEAEGVRLVVDLPWMFIDERDRAHWVDYRATFVETYRSVVLTIAAEPGLLLRSDAGAFCDSPFHLWADARRQRSAYLAAALRPFATQAVVAAGAAATAGAVGVAR